MKGKLKKLLITSIFACVFLFAGIFTACDFSFDFMKVKLTGFDVKESVTVDYGAIVNVETPIVTDQNGNLYEVWTDVSDSKGGYVGVESNSFRAWDIGGYTITYVVRVNECQSEEKKTTVTVTNTQGLTVTAEYETLVDTDTPIAILPECEEEGVTYSYSVKKLADNSEIPVTETDGEVSFVLEEKGYYDVMITATKGDRTGIFGYALLAREATSPYVVEHFDEQWEEIANYEEDQRLGYYQTVTSEECGITDRYGDNVTMLMRRTDNEWPNFHISPRYSYEHYESLIEQGYDKVTLWCYYTSEKDVEHKYVIKTGKGNYYETTARSAKANTWVELSFQLETPANAVSHSFLYCYDWYKSQEIWYVCWWNEGSLADRDVMTMYYTDMLVTKPVEVKVAENPKTSYQVGDTLTMDYLQELFSSDVEMRYFIKSRGVSTEITEDYVFTANGDYELEVLPARKDYRANAKLELTVTDEFSANASYVSVNRTGKTTVDVNLQDLKANFTTVGGVTPQAVGYRVYDRKGNEYQVSQNGFKADADGVYKVEVEGEYKLGTTTCKTYHFVELDVWSNDNKYSAVDLDGYFSIAGYNYQSTLKDTLTIGEYTVGDRTENLLKVYAAGRECSVIVMRPTYTKNYYQALLDENPYYASYVNMDWYFVASTAVKTGEITPYYDMFTGYVKQGAQTKDVWNTGKITLREFVALYDDIVSLYESTLEEYANAVKFGRFVDTKGVVDPNGNIKKGYVMATKLQTNRAECAYLTDMTISILDSEIPTYSYSIDETTFMSQKIGSKIDLTQGKALFNGFELKATEYKITSKTENLATVENNVLTVKGSGMIELVFTVTLSNGKVYDSITYKYEITPNNEDVDAWENDGLGDSFTP